MKQRNAVSTIVLTLLLACASLAHDTWLLPQRAQVTRGTTIRLDLTSGMKFPFLDTAIKPERVKVARCRLNGKTIEVTERSAGPKSLQFNVTLPEEGVATIWVELAPRTLELKPNLVEEYFAELNASRELRKIWNNGGKDRRWRESYVKHAKTFVEVGTASRDQSWKEPVGMALEIMPEKDPTALRANDALPVRVLKDGAPLSNFSVGIVREGNTLARFARTDKEGRATFRLARKGRWMFRGTDLRQSTKPDLEWESDFTTMTPEVR